ncbi:MAG TPA: flavodoxin domain-containing protein [Alphaproteobacteria bacterium]|nr:flavodoxin domain-containing protein [Alphaproteobacteria bacterium]
MASFTILVGTMTGTAEIVAEEIRDALAPKGHAIEIQLMDGLDAGVFAPGRTYLICTSTYGQGDVPDNAMALYEDLQRRRPDLSEVRYGVLSLGDRTYAQTFCNGGQRFDEILSALKAERIGEIMRHDASAGTVPEEVGVAWAERWVAELEARLSEAA